MKLHFIKWNNLRPKIVLSVKVIIKYQNAERYEIYQGSYNSTK